MRPKGSLWVCIGPYISFCVLMNFNWVLMGPYRSLFGFICSNGSLYILTIAYAFVWTLMRPYGSF